MKRYLNLNDYGGKAISVIAVFIGIIPALLYLINYLLDRLHARVHILDTLRFLSLRLGFILLILFILLVIIEQIQDAWLDRWYQKKNE